MMLELHDCLARVKEQHPLTLCITNEVTINECANALLAIGASPVMSGDPEDARSLAALAGATVINTGTCNAHKLEIMLAAGQGAKKAGRPVILDPVGVGATGVRRAICGQIIDEIKPDIIRGNFSEIKTLAGLASEQKGVDSTENLDAESAASIAKSLASNLKSIIAISGQIDVVSDGEKVFFIQGGSPLMTRITGTGCLLSAVVGGYAGANPNNKIWATVAAMGHLALAGERAEKSSIEPAGLGSFRVSLFDHLSLIKSQDLLKMTGVSKNDGE